MAENLLTRFGLDKKEGALYMTLLSLYELVIFVDDSISMVTEENGSRVEALKHTLEIIADVYSLSRDENPKGINIKFFNSTKRYTNVRKKHVAGIVDKHRFQGLTRIGTELKRKILDSFVKPTMERPVLIITITDGDIEGEDRGYLESVIYACVNGLRKEIDPNSQDKRPRGNSGAHAVAFQFARVGNDQGAAALLETLDNDENIGNYVDCLEVGIQDILDESKTWPVLSKLFLGGISEYWDNFLSSGPMDKKDFWESDGVAEEEEFTFSDDD